MQYYQKIVSYVQYFEKLCLIMQYFGKAVSYDAMLWKNTIPYGILWKNRILWRKTLRKQYHYCYSQYLKSGFGIDTTILKYSFNSPGYWTGWIMDRLDSGVVEY